MALYFIYLFIPAAVFAVYAAIRFAAIEKKASPVLFIVRPRAVNFLAGLCFCAFFGINSRSSFVFRSTAEMVATNAVLLCGILIGILFIVRFFALRIIFGENYITEAGLFSKVTVDFSKVGYAEITTARYSGTRTLHMYDASGAMLLSVDTSLTCYDLVLEKLIESKIEIKKAGVK